MRNIIYEIHREEDTRSSVRGSTHMPFFLYLRLSLSLRFSSFLPLTSLPGKFSSTMTLTHAEATFAYCFYSRRENKRLTDNTRVRSYAIVSRESSTFHLFPPILRRVPFFPVAFSSFPFIVSYRSIHLFFYCFRFESFSFHIFVHQTCHRAGVIALNICWIHQPVIEIAYLGQSPVYTRATLRCLNEFARKHDHTIFPPQTIFIFFYYRQFIGPTQFFIYNLF